MSQASPTNLLLAQAAYFINRLRREYSVRKFKAPDEIAEVIEKALTNFEEHAGTSLIPYEPIFPSEVPNSAKMNRFWSGLQFDVNALQEQVDLLRAASISTHNFIKTEVEKAKRDNLKSQNKLKTLQLYSNVTDPSLVYFGDTFITEELMDWNSLSLGESRLRILGKQVVGLDIESQESALAKNPSITILKGSNGFLGNWHEIMDPDEFFVIDSSTGQKSYYLKSETYPADDLDAVVDAEPTSWIEFEKYYVPETDRSSALNYNFHYKYINSDRWKYLSDFVEGDGVLNWADGLGSNGRNGTLVFNFEIDLKAPQKANIIKFLPFGLADNVNNPIKIKTVTTSADRSVWYTLNPQNVWIANGIDRKLIEINEENIVIGECTWTTNGEAIRYVRFSIEQPRPIQANIGHNYYLLRSQPNTNNPQAVVRQLGPIPTLDDPNLYAENSNRVPSNLIQKMEYFNGERWAIGIRDIDIRANSYRSHGTFVSRLFEVAGIVDRVSLDAEIEIPSEYDESYPWIQFFLSPNDGQDWFPISRIQDDFLEIPEIIAFNDPTPVELREPGVGYYEVEGVVSSLRLKVEMERPDELEFTTPVLKPYRLNIKKRV